MTPVLLAGGLSPYGWVDAAFERVGQGGLWAAGVGLAAGAVLGLAPVALLALPAVAAVVSPTLPTGAGRGGAVARSVPRVAGFVVGMDAPLAAAGFFLSEVGTALVRASVVLALVTAVLLAAAGLWSLVRRGAARSRLTERSRRTRLTPSGTASSSA